MSVDRLIQRFTTAFGEPKTDDPRAYLWEITEALKNYSPEIVFEAASRIIRARVYKSWPTTGEIRQAAEEAAAERAAMATTPASTAPLVWTRQRVQEADRLVRSSPIGKRAAAEGWLLGLHDFARNHGRLPMSREIPPMIRDAKITERAAAGEMSPSPISATLATMALSLIAKRDALAERLFG